MTNFGLSAVQQRLDAAGVRDVKIFFTSAVHAMPPSAVKDNVAFILTTYLDGYKEKLPYFGDHDERRL